MRKISQKTKSENMSNLIKGIIFIIVITATMFALTTPIKEENTDYTSSRLRSSSIMVSFPTQGSILRKGKTYDIEWTSSGVSYVRIEVYKGGLYHSTIDTREYDDGDYRWSVSSYYFTTGTDYQIKISDYYDSSDYTYSGYFTITDPASISVTSPSYYDTWLAGNPYTIRWTSSGEISNVKIEFCRTSTQITTITSSTPDDGSYTYTVPITFSTSMSCRIRISDASDSSIYDYSDYFYLFANPLIQIIIVVVGSIACASVIAVSAVLISKQRKELRQPVKPVKPIQPVKPVYEKEAVPKTVEKETPTTRFCRNCGSAMSDDDQFCKECGAKS